jgi:hypothetical protein
VDLHRGTVVVMDAPGGGALFQVELPARAPDGAYVRSGGGRDAPALADAASPIAPELPQLAGEAFHPGKPTVLVAEDNPDLRLFLTTCCRTSTTWCFGRTGSRPTRRPSPTRPT